MPRVAKAKMRKLDHFPWYEWVEEFEWDDDEFEDRKNGTIEQRRIEADLFERLQTKERQYEVRIV